MGPPWAGRATELPGHSRDPLTQRGTETQAETERQTENTGIETAGVRQGEPQLAVTQPVLCPAGKK